MSTQSNAMSDVSAGTHAIAAPLVPVRPFYWSLRRELWENRSIYIVPLIGAAVMLLGFVVGLGRPHHMTAVMGIDASHPHGDPMQPYDVAAGMFMLAQMLVGVFYCLDALHGERIDRSILFWKSMPVSDVTTVLSKATIPFVILPLLMFVFTVITHSIMFALNGAVWIARGQNVGALYAQVPLLSIWMLTLYHLLAVHTFWHAPFYAWMMLVSAWARRAPLLWATLPLLALGALEKIIFNTTYFGHMLLYRLGGGGEDAATAPGSMPIGPMTHATPLRFLGTSGLWTGLILSAIFLAIAVRVRRSRAPI